MMHLMDRRSKSLERTNMSDNRHDDEVLRNLFVGRSQGDKQHN